MSDKQLVNNTNTNNFSSYLTHEFWEDFKRTFSIKQQVTDFKSLTKSQSTLLVVGIIAQAVAFIFQKDFSFAGWMGIIAGVSTMTNLILIDVGLITNYSWGFISCLSWLIVSLHSWLLSDIATQAFFVAMQLVGIWTWGKALRKIDQHRVKPLKMSVTQGATAILGAVVLYLILYALASHFNSSQPALDSTLLPLNIIGQVLMNFRYRSQWIAWILVDIISIVIWYNQLKVLSPASLSMLVLNITMLINALYGAYLWNREKGLQDVTNSEHN